VRRHHVVCLAFVVSAGVLVSAQAWPAIPPIPLQERFRARTDLAITLKLNASQLLAGEQPIVTLAIRNTGTKTLRVPPHVSTNYNVQLRVFDASGRALGSTMMCVSQSLLLTSSVRSHLRIAPGQSRAFTLDRPCGWPSFPVGNYQFEATYRNYADSYDLYEEGASETWEGRITTARASFTVLPLDAETERSLIATLDADGPPNGIDDAIRRLGLGGSASATPALVRQFDRDPRRRFAIAWAFVHLPDPGAAAALGEAIERASLVQESLPLALAGVMVEDGWLRFVQRAQDCSALALVINMHSLPLGTVKQLDSQCPDLRARLLKASQPPSSIAATVEYRHLAERAARAASLLKRLDTPAIPPPEAPPEEESFDDDIRPDPAAVTEYVRAVIAGVEDERVRKEALKGIARFGTVEDFRRLKEALARCRDDCAAGWLISPALVAMTFVSDLEVKTEQLPFWDVWWKNHAGQTRVQWAREALAREPLRSRLVRHDTAPSRAAEFLLANQGLSPALVRELTQHRSWLVRLAVADDVARADERSGGRLFIRELSNRYVGACATANERLELLVRKRYRFDCTDPAERQKAIAHWTKVVDSMEPGFLPLTVAQLQR